MTAASVNGLETCFREIERCAIAGKRCPMNGTYGVESSYVGQLCRAGRVRVEISMHNYRTVYLLTGGHAGKFTAPDPGRNKPWKIIDATGSYYSGKRVSVSSYETRPQPSAPQLLKRPA